MRQHFTHITWQKVGGWKMPKSWLGWNVKIEEFFRASGEHPAMKKEHVQICLILYRDAFKNTVHSDRELKQAECLYHWVSDQEDGHS